MTAPVDIQGRAKELQEGVAYHKRLLSYHRKKARENARALDELRKFCADNGIELIEVTK